MWTEISYSLFLNIFQGGSGQRGPEGLMGKPGEDVSQPFDLFTPNHFSLTLVFTALDRTIHILIYPKGTADNLLPTITVMIFKQHFSSMFFNLMERTVKAKLFSH